MQYLKPSFTLPVSDTVSQERWDEIFEQDLKTNLNRAINSAFEDQFYSIYKSEGHIENIPTMIIERQSWNK